MAAAVRVCPGAELPPTGADLGGVQSATLCLVNRVRAAHRLAALRANATLADVAHSQVDTMVSSNYFADVRPSGQTPLALVASTSYARRGEVAVGQNIAWGTGADAQAAQIVAAWMRSPAHRRIILTAAYRDAGVAIAPVVPAVLGAGPDGATYVIEFGARTPR